MVKQTGIAQFKRELAAGAVALGVVGCVIAKDPGVRQIFAHGLDALSDPILDVSHPRPAGAATSTHPVLRPAEALPGDQHGLTRVDYLERLAMVALEGALIPAKRRWNIEMARPITHETFPLTAYEQQTFAQIAEHESPQSE